MPDPATPRVQPGERLDPPAYEWLKLLDESFVCGSRGAHSTLSSTDWGSISHCRTSGRFAGCDSFDAHRHRYEPKGEGGKLALVRRTCDVMASTRGTAVRPALTVVRRYSRCVRRVGPLPWWQHGCARGSASAIGAVDALTVANGSQQYGCIAIAMSIGLPGDSEAWPWQASRSAISMKK